MRRFLPKCMAVSVLAIASTAWAVDDDAGWTDCQRTLLDPQPSAPVVIGSTQFPGGKSFRCWEWENSSTATDVFRVRQNAMLQFNADRDDATKPPTAGGTIVPRSCPEGTTTCSTTECSAVLPSGCTSLDGTDGDASSQCWQVNVGPALYCATVGTAIPEGDEAILRIVGSDSL